jgi:hypothetical protein
MTDDLVIRLSTEACEALSNMEFWMGCEDFIATYNRLLKAAKANHPKDEFLNSLLPLEVKPPDTPSGPTESQAVLDTLSEALKGKEQEESPPPSRLKFLAAQLRMVLKGKKQAQWVPPARLKFLFAQLRILVEAIQTESSERKQ